MFSPFLSFLSLILTLFPLFSKIPDTMTHQNCHLIFLLLSSINILALTILFITHLLCLSSLPICLCLQTSSLTGTCNVCDLFMINPLIALHQNSCMIHSKLRDGHLILNGVFVLVLLRVLRKGELSFCLSSIFTRHDDGGKGAKELTNIHLISKGPCGASTLRGGTVTPVTH